VRRVGVTKARARKDRFCFSGDDVLTGFCHGLSSGHLVDGIGQWLGWRSTSIDWELSSQCSTSRPVNLQGEDVESALGTSPGVRSFAGHIGKSHVPSM